MNCELAKKLKEAGFPNSDGWTYHDIDTNEEIWIDELLPTLSELIEACGEDFGVLVLLSKEDVEKHEYQKKNNKNYYCTIDIIEGWRCVGKDSNVYYDGGSTPDEAVSNLWLALQNKK